jgi:hypothetical protein
MSFPCCPIEAPCADHRRYQVIADGIAWEDSDGRTVWPRAEADALADHLASQGYKDVEVIQA